MKTKHVVLLSASWLLLLLSGCRKEPNLSELASEPAVITSRSKAAVFPSFKTYYISDTIAYVSASSTDSVLTGPDAQQLVNAIKQNMAAKGYTLVSRSQSPDLGINTILLKILMDQSVYYPGYWGGYPGYWGSGYWGYYNMGYYYPYGTTYYYMVGTFVMNVIDLKNATAHKNLEVIWTGYLTGYLGDNTSTNIAAGVEGINQAFKQSPYFTTY